MSTTRRMDSKSVKNIMNRRSLITGTEKGKVILTVQGNGNVIDVTDAAGEPVANVVAGDGTQLQKKIFNLKANSAIAMANPINKQLLKDAIAAEKAGESEKAHELFSQYLNKVQVSFGLLLPSKFEDELADGVEIAAKVQKVTTEKGSLLTIDTATISIVAPAEAAMTSFSLPDEDEDETDDESVETPAETEKLDA